VGTTVAGAGLGEAGGNHSIAYPSHLIGQGEICTVWGLPYSTSLLYAGSPVLHAMVWYHRLTLCIAWALRGCLSFPQGQQGCGGQPGSCGHLPHLPPQVGGGAHHIDRRTHGGWMRYLACCPATTGHPPSYQLAFETVISPCGLIPTYT
jgi:hypothetical protein